jgi:hypothetical protein
MAKKKVSHTSSAPLQDKVTFYNKLSPNYRSVHADGAYGGITPRGFVNISFFSERQAIPRSSVYTFNHEEKTVVKLNDSEDSKDGIIREYDFGVYMNLDTAKKLIELLTLKVNELEIYLKSQDNDADK